jgi:hypothetical protein
LESAIHAVFFPPLNLTIHDVFEFFFQSWKQELLSSAIAYVILSNATLVVFLLQGQLSDSAGILIKVVHDPHTWLGLRTKQI